MTAPADAGELAALEGRLLDGVHDSFALTRRASHAEADARLLRDWPRAVFAPLPHIRDDTWDPRNEPLATIERLTADLRASRPLLAAVIFSPHLVLARTRVLCGSAGRNLTPAQVQLDAWIATCWTTEAAWDAVTGVLPGDAGYLTGDAELLRPAAARTRFLLLSEPMRHRAKVGGTMWEADRDALGGNGVLDSVFGLDSWAELVGRCRDARREWQGCLNGYQSQSLLRHAKPAKLEQEVRTLLFGTGPSGLLVLSVQPLAAATAVTPEDMSVITDSAEMHLLPRFAVGMVARLALHDDRPRWQWARRLFAAGVALAGLGSVAWAAALSPYQAAWCALACYALMVAGIALLPEGWGMLWLLRMPAASAIGVLALIALVPGGWAAQTRRGAWILTAHQGWAAAGALTAVAFGYLLVEVRNHGAGRRAAALRALAVGVTGLVHALMVAMIGLVIVAPALVQNAAQLTATWTHPGYRHAWVIIAFATSWCLAVGVFSQILWDDQPITAALSHLSWRR